MNLINHIFSYGMFRLMCSLALVFLVPGKMAFGQVAKDAQSAATQEVSSSEQPSSNESSTDESGPRASEVTEESAQDSVEESGTNSQSITVDNVDKVSPDTMAHVYAFGLGVGLSAAGSVTWKFVTKWTGEFQTINEGWFGKETYAGGADKVGHMYTDFVLGRGFYKIYRAHGYSKAESIGWAFAAGSLTRTAMEVADGYTTFGFSPGDLTFNMLGASANALLLLDDDVAETFYLSWSYLPSREVYEGYHDPFDFSTDYSGMVFGLNAEVSGLKKLMGVNESSSFDDTYVGLNYYTRNFRQSDDSLRERFVGMSLGISLDRKLPEGHWSRPILKFVKLPFTFAGIAYSIDHENLEAKWGLNYLF